MNRNEDVNTPLEIYKSVIQKEADALLTILREADEKAASEAIKLVVNCLGKVVCIGVGKSGLIGRKLAATLSSLGIGSIPMHASDALHGDIGSMSPNDVAIILSNSGSTEEILLLLPHLKLRNILCISIVGDMETQLAKSSDVVLSTRVPFEADTHNLAPTCSTTAQLAIGDAIAVAAAASKGITPKDFAYNHPAGKLGKRLTLTVNDLMLTDNDNPTLTVGSNIKEVIDAIAKFQSGAISLVSHIGTLEGIITDGDLRRTLQKTKATQWDSLESNAMMTATPTTADPNMLAIDALKIMEERASQISVLPVVDVQYKVVGMVRLHDLVRAGL